MKDLSEQLLAQGATVLSPLHVLQRAEGNWTSMTLAEWSPAPVAKLQAAILSSSHVIPSLAGLGEALERGQRV
eukprot:symbB.v1.2.011893.t1/scaffold806.1/size231046/20